MTTTDERAAIVREICHREGHNWAWITTMSHRWAQWTCIRGCGARRHGDPQGRSTVQHLRGLIAGLDDDARVEGLSIIVEGK